jgi:hypothetical protein
LRQAAPESCRTVFSALALALSVAWAGGAHAQIDGEDGPVFPTTEFAEGEKSASVTVGNVTAGVRMVRRANIDPDADIPLLEVLVGGARVIEVPGVASGLDYPAAEASIAEIDPGNALPEVYFTSFSGGAHCCSTVVVAEQVGDKWVAVPVGDFDGDGNYLEDLDGDGLAEIATVDNRFLYQFDCYACSAAPLIIRTMRGGKALDVSAERRFLAAHREWLKEIEDSVDPEGRWTSPGYLAGWVAAKARVGEGAEAWKELNRHWDLANDPGEEVCLTGAELDDCPRKSRATLKFPERLKLFLDKAGYAF